MYLAIAIILFTLVLRYDIRSDYRKWLKNIPVDHSRDAWKRSLLLLPAMAFFIIAKGPGSWPLMVYTISMMFFTYWLMFDGLYNHVRKFGWWFTGSNDKDDAGTDNFLQSVPKWLHILIKLAGTAGSIAAYIFLC